MWFSRRKWFGRPFLLVSAAALAVVAPGDGHVASAAWPGVYACGDRPCGPEWLPGPLKLLIPQQVGGADFRPACRMHDWCYTSGAMDRRSCDLAFRDQLFDACAYSRHPVACRATAQTMFIFSRAFGRRAYDFP